MGPDDFDPAAEAALAMQEAGVNEPDVNEIPLDGRLLAGQILIQCLACAERGQDTVLQLRFTNTDSLDDLHVVCPACTGIAQAEAPGVKAVIVVTCCVGEEAEAIDDALERAAQAMEGEEEDDPGLIHEIDDSSHPFRGPATAERPAPIPVDE